MALRPSLGVRCQSPSLEGTTSAGIAALPIFLIYAKAAALLSILYVGIVMFGSSEIPMERAPMERAMCLGGGFAGNCVTPSKKRRLVAPTRQAAAAVARQTCAPPAQKFCAPSPRQVLRDPGNGLRRDPGLCDDAHDDVRLEKR